MRPAIDVWEKANEAYSQALFDKADDDAAAVIQRDRDELVREICEWLREELGVTYRSKWAVSVNPTVIWIADEIERKFFERRKHQ